MEDAAAAYRKHAEELVRFATSLVGPTAAADVVAEAVIRAMSSPGWQSVTHQRQYLFRSVLNESRMHHRSTMAREARELRAAALRVEEEPPVLRPEVAEALAGLDLRERAVVFLTFWEDLEARDVGRWLGISVRTVRRDLTTARRKLRGLLSD